MQPATTSIRPRSIRRGLVWFVFAIACCLFSTGCVTGRRNVALDIPTLPPDAPTKGEIAIVSVIDARRFENKPANPATPSVEGDVDKLSPQERATFIGRQRNSYGKAMGDITLPAGDSVLLRGRALMEEGLKRAGYTVVPADRAPASTVTLKLTEFWSWLSPGMWSVGFDARVFAELTFQKGDKSQTLKVRGDGTNRGQVAKNENWQLAYKRAFSDFLEQLQSTLRKEGW